MIEKILKFFRIEKLPPRAWFNWTVVVAVALSVIMGVPDAIHSYHTLVARHVGALQAFTEEAGVLIFVNALMCFMFIVLLVYLYQFGLMLVDIGKSVSRAIKGLPAAWASFSAWLVRVWQGLCTFGRWLRAVPAGIARGFRFVRAMRAAEWLAVVYFIISIGLLSGIFWFFWGPAGAIVRHAPHWLVSDTHDRIFMTAIVAYIFSILPWSISLALVSTTIKVAIRRISGTTGNTREK